MFTDRSFFNTVGGLMLRASSDWFGSTGIGLPGFGSAFATVPGQFRSDLSPGYCGAVGLAFWHSPCFPS